MTSTGREATSTSISFRLLRFEEIGEEELAILIAGCEKSGHDPAEFADAVMAGQAIVWRVKGPETDGIVITQENTYRGEPALFLWYLCGVGAQACQAYCQQVLTDFARRRGLKRMWAKAHPKQYELTSKPMGWKIDELTISKEV